MLKQFEAALAEAGAALIEAGWDWTFKQFEAALIEAGWDWTTAKKYARGAKVFVYWLATGKAPEKWETGSVDPARVV